ncbi:TPA: hypothetical protein GXZ54_00965 [bacterium]|nr:hypothetical protein [bacterium]
MYNKNMNGGRPFLQFLRALIPSRLRVKIEYRIKCKRKLNLKYPKRFSEKIQWYKLNYKTPLMTRLVAKDTVRDYVEERGLKHILNEVYGIYENVDHINFDILPNEFVIKLNTGSGLNIIVKDKKELNINEVKRTLRKWLKVKPWIFGSEWAYKKVKPKIVIEKYLEELTIEGISDYKFFSFDGEIEYLYVYNINQFGEKVSSVFNINFENTGFYRNGYKPIEGKLKKPDNFDEMIEYARILSKGIPHVRVDLYNIKGKILFGEMTFYSRGGYNNFIPDEFDYILGSKFQLSTLKSAHGDLHES